jgi:hypothetical protein
MLPDLGHRVWVPENSVSNQRKNSRIDRGDISMSRFIHAKKKVKAKQRCNMQLGRWVGSREGSILEVLRPQAFIEVYRHGMVRTGQQGCGS